jgi:hypothetical protein
VTANLAAIHTALADQIRLNVQRDINVSPHPNSGMPLPLIEVWPATEYIDYYSLSDSDDGVLAVRFRLLVATASNSATEFKIITDLLTWDGPHSIRAAVMADRTLGGTVDSAVVLSAEWDADAANLAAWIPVETIAQRE